MLVFDFDDSQRRSSQATSAAGSGRRGQQAQTRPRPADKLLATCCRQNLDEDGRVPRTNVVTLAALSLVKLICSSETCIGTVITAIIIIAIIIII